MVAWSPANATQITSWGRRAVSTIECRHADGASARAYGGTMIDTRGEDGDIGPAAYRQPPAASSASRRSPIFRFLAKNPSGNRIDDRATSAISSRNYTTVRFESARIPISNDL